MPMDGSFAMKSGTKAGTQSLPTPMPMSTNASTVAEINGPVDYKAQVGGIVPGYAGHMPRSRDKYAGSAHGGISPERGPPLALGPQQGHVRPEDVIPPVFESFVQSSKGVMPGYTGFRPEARHVHNVSAFGGIPPSVAAPEPETLAQGNRNFDWRRGTDLPPAPPSFRDNVGGILPGYTGHVPRATEKHGTSHFGGLSPDKSYVPLAQTGHEGYKVSAPGQAPGQPGEKDVELKMIPNYQVRRSGGTHPQGRPLLDTHSTQSSARLTTRPDCHVAPVQGFIPKARDAFGTSIYTKGR